MSREYTASTKQLEHISDQEATYSGLDYTIDWEEVKLGKAAGMPGGWKTDPVSSTKSSCALYNMSPCTVTTFVITKFARSYKYWTVFSVYNVLPIRFTTCICAPYILYE